MPPFSMFRDTGASRADYNVIKSGRLTQCYITSPIYPPGLINETIQTLALLFPQDDSPTRKWLQRVSKALRLPLDHYLSKCGILDAENRDFENFKFWHDRLVVLKQVYNESRPADISQRWYDRRHPSEWYTVWTAILVIILTVLFGFIQIALTAVQVYLALKTPLDICTCPS